MQRTVVSGITPSGNSLHIGNYFGAVKPQIELQNHPDYQTFYFIADLHALTTVQNQQVLADNCWGVVLDYLSLGLDPDRAVFFRQSDVAAHSQLAIVLANFVAYGQMKRMHAFKDKLQKGSDEEAINMGLFNYPILMAADILAYRPALVPVGEDQRQHVELTRDIAERFNHQLGSEVLTLPEPLIASEVGRIVGTDGQRKMSKSLGNTIGIFEDPPVIEKQIMSSFTDPERKKATDPGKVEGNPVFIYHDLINDDFQEVAELKDRYRAGTVGDVEVKRRLVAAHQRCFGEARARRQVLAGQVEHVRHILAQGAGRARQTANQTLMEIYAVLGVKNQLSAARD